MRPWGIPPNPVRAEKQATAARQRTEMMRRMRILGRLLLAAAFLAFLAYTLCPPSWAQSHGGGGAPAPVATNAALAASPITSYPSGVWRTDYAAGNGAPPLFFTPQTGTCAANGLVNDGGSCVNGAGGNSWKSARLPGSTIDVKQYGAVCNAFTANPTDDTAALQAAINANQNKTSINSVATLIIPGQCYTTSQLVISGQIAIKSSGHGVGEIVRAGGATDSAVKISTTGTGISGWPHGVILLQDIQITSKTGRSGNANAHALELSGGTQNVNLVLNRVALYNTPGDGLHSGGFNGAVLSSDGLYAQNGGYGISSNSDNDWISFRDQVYLNTKENLLLSGDSSFEFHDLNAFSGHANSIQLFGTTTVQFFGGQFDLNTFSGVDFANFTGDARFFGTRFSGNNVAASTYGDLHFGGTTSGTITLTAARFTTDYNGTGYNLYFDGGVTPTVYVDNATRFAVGSAVAQDATNTPSLVILPPRTLARNGADHACTADGAEHNLYVIPVLAGALGPNGRIHIDHSWFTTSNANAKQQIIRVATTSGATSGGTVLYNQGASTTGDAKLTLDIMALNSYTSQWAVKNGAYGYSNVGTQGAAIDTRSNWYININCTSVNGSGDTNTLRGVNATLVN